MLTTTPLDEIEKALTAAWSTYRRACAEHGAESPNAASAMTYVDKLLDMRLESA